MYIEHAFDGGSIEVLRARRCDDVRLALRTDTAADFRQWFSFRARGVAGRDCRFRILNAGDATYADAFEDYLACASPDGRSWFRVPTSFDGEVLTIADTPRTNRMHYAYFAPYPSSRHRALLRDVARQPAALVRPVARTSLGRSVDEVQAGSGPAQVWITARQHPGETMAEWFIEGLLRRLLSDSDPISEELFARATFHVVPNMNPDGSALGNHRTNANGRDLNRAWADPDEEVPEVAGVLARMHETDVQLYLDIHGDERNPWVFAAGCEGNPSYDDDTEQAEDVFMGALEEIDPDFQRTYGYSRDAPGEGDLNCANNLVGEAFRCLALTVEMPFKDAANNPDPDVGWSPLRAAQLGSNALEAVLIALDSLG